VAFSKAFWDSSDIEPYSLNSRVPGGFAWITRKRNCSIGLFEPLEESSSIRHTSFPEESSVSNSAISILSYATVDLRAEYPFTKAWRAQARIANLFDRDYETLAFFNQPGRSLFLTLRYQP